MKPEWIFTAATFTAMAGWAMLAAGVVFNNAMLRDFTAGRIVPAILAIAYSVLIALFWAGSQGGFGQPRRCRQPVRQSLAAARRLGALSRLRASSSCPSCR